MPPEGVRAVLTSSDCAIDLARRELRVRGIPIPIGGRAFEIIEVLALSAGELVTKDELMERVWPGAVVMEGTLHVHVSALRKALGPYRDLLKTVSRRGYCLLGNWSVQRQDAKRSPVGPRRMAIDGDASATNIPATITRLVGRASSVARVRDFISAYRAVTLTGPGGIGKSSLALKIARRIVGEYANGGWIVELELLSDPTLVPAAVASTLRLPERSDSVTAGAVARVIGNMELLLVLDNCEHVIGAVAALAEVLLAHCPRVTILATSRENLRIQGEHIYRVPPLEVPTIEQIESGQTPRHSALELFIDRAQELGTDFSSTANAPMIAEICRQLDGIPLAIEFAAARAAVLGLEPVASGLRGRFDSLTNTRRTALPRHRTLRATLDWSYELLTEARRELLRRVAIFVCPFTIEAARAVATEGTTVDDVADGIADLIGKSLVLKGPDPVTADFRLFETTRAYVFDRLVESGAHAEVASRHVEYLLQAVAGIEADRQSKPQHEYLVALRHRAHEIHAALNWTFAGNDPGIGVTLTIAAVPLWFELSQMNVARRRVEQALRHVEPDGEQEMRLRLALGHAIWYTTPENDDLEPAFARALEIAKRIDAGAVQIQALWGMWAARRGRGDFPAALVAARHYAEVAASAGDRAAMHLADRILGLTHHMLGDQPTARAYTERALREPRLLDPTSAIGYQIETPVAMGAQLGRVLWLLGFPDRAKNVVNEAVEGALLSSRSYAIPYVMIFGALPVALWRGEVDDERRWLDLLAAHAGGNRIMDQWLLFHIRLRKLREGGEREKLIASCIMTSFAGTIPPFADLPLDANIEVPLPRPPPLDARWDTPEALRVDADLLLWHNAPGAVAAAEAKLSRALEIARAHAALSWELRVVTSLARLWRRHGRITNARDLLAATYGKFTEGFETSDLIDARSLLTDL
jgi:predicted ATPase/DNA-binding winged helix-turn-helix (wHTH) protein